MSENKKPRAKGTSHISRPGTPATKSKFPPKASAKPEAGTKAQRAAGNAGSRFIDERIRSLGDWRATTLSEVREMIHEAAPDIVEERKWVKPSNPAGVPVWSQDGIVCTGETYKQVVKLTFARGADLKDPRKLFNSSLEGNTRRAIDIREGEALDPDAFKALIQAAIEENRRVNASKSKSSTKATAKSETDAKGTPGATSKRVAKAKSVATPTASDAKPAKGQRAEKVVLLSGGNPQIAKADGDAPVQAYIAAMPGWKRDLGARLDALIERNVPHVRKAVKWNSPFYGIEGQGWFVSFHVFTHYVKVTFFAGTSLRPVPAGGTSKDARWIDIREDDEFDEAQLTKWVNQAAALPGWAT